MARAMEHADPTLAKLSLRFHMDFPDPRTFRFTNYAKRVIDTETALSATRPLSHLVSSVPAGVASAISSHPTNDLASEIRELKGMFEAHMTQTDGCAAATGRTARQRRNRPPIPAPHLIASQQPQPSPARVWCWTHGLCSHRSPECRAPAKGHRKDATERNTLGGAPTDRRVSKR